MSHVHGTFQTGEHLFQTIKVWVRRCIQPGHNRVLRGKGQAESFCSCSHGAGRVMTRTEANRRFTVDDHIAATAGVECRKDAAVIDETPMAYKSIDAVMHAQRDLVEIVHTLRQVVCVKG